MDTLIPAFTHCNVYAPSWTYDGVPIDRVWHDYLVVLRLRGVDSTVGKEYLNDHRTEVLSFFFVNWDQLYYGTNPELTEKTIEELSIRYQEFAKKDFLIELKKIN